jgi:hypothetical protein
MGVLQEHRVFFDQLRFTTDMSAGGDAVATDEAARHMRRDMMLILPRLVNEAKRLHMALYQLADPVRRGGGVEDSPAPAPAPAPALAPVPAPAVAAVK